MTKIYENDERDKLLPILITINLNTLKSVGIRKSLNSMKYSFSNPSTP
jgi:hypothetical protein